MGLCLFWHCGAFPNILGMKTSSRLPCCAVWRTTTSNITYPIISSDFQFPRLGSQQSGFWPTYLKVPDWSGFQIISRVTVTVLRHEQMNYCPIAIIYRHNRMDVSKKTSDDKDDDGDEKEWMERVTWDRWAKRVLIIFFARYLFSWMSPIHWLNRLDM